MPPAETEVLITRRAPEAPTSWNTEARTFEVVFATNAAAVERYDMRGAYRETLAVEGFTVVDPTPFLDGHRRDSLDAVLGQIVSTRTVGGKAIAVVRLSRNNPLAVRLGPALADGLRFGVSCGYTVEEWRETTDTKTGIRTKVALRWTVREISVVTIPADRQATTRGAAMADPTPTPAPAPATDPAALPPVPSPTIAPAQPPTPETRSANPEITNRANVNTEIRTIARTLGLNQAWVDGQIDRSATADQARAAALDELQRRSAAGTVPTTPVISIGTDYSAPEFRVRTMGEALYARVNRAHNPTEPARQFVGHSMTDMARDCLRSAGVPLSGLASATLVQRALETTSDYPLILGDALGRTLRDTYRAVPSALKGLGRQVNATDFRTRHRLVLSEAPQLDKLNESGEVKTGSLAEARESYKLTTYAKRFGISRQVIVNDDLGAFSDLARRFGQGAAATEAALLVQLLEGAAGDGPTMSDGKALFHSDHKNKGAAVDWTSANPPLLGGLDAARLAMRKQVGLKGELIAVTPKWLVVPSDLETYAEKYLAAIHPATTADVNPLSGKLTLVVEPRLTGTKRWYVAADPAEVDGLEWSYLEGEEGPQITTRAGFEVEGVEVKVRLDFGCGFTDWRSWYQNPGQ
jgi:hypothetical protein